MMEYYALMKRSEEALTHATTWMHLKNRTLSERSQAQRGICHVRAPSHKISKIVNFREIESRQGASRNWERGSGELFLKRQGLG